ncbi:hypothetical protein [Treponema sp. C6A8]|uniref:hypothetical protein n=1 Tax=Treponema sp. C6A8 TaxID=1410609 RepID=UPI000480895E|nr:hypothetical protein [Treponema sp. C6A8]
MKKNIKLFGLLTILSSLFFTACYDAVFYEILQDVESEDATVSGTIQQISRYTIGSSQYLLCNADGGLRYKLINSENRTHGKWSTYSHLPFSLHSYDYYGSSHNGEQIIQVLTDSTNIYLLTCVYFDDNDEGTVAPKTVKLWTAELSSFDTAGSWTCINESTSETAKQIFKVYKNKDSGYYYSAFCIFSTNTIKPENRHVYVRSGKHGAWYSGKSKNISSSELTTPVLYEVTPSGLNPVTTYPIAFDAALYSDGYKNNICSAAYFNDKTNFFCSPAVVTNESSAKTKTTPDFVYYSNGSTLYYSKKPSTGDWPTYSGSIGASHNISALAVCADSILIGMGNTTVYSTSTSGGITHSYLNGGVPTGTTTFSTNATSQISSGYIVYSLLNEDPAENETDSALYASIGFCGSGSSNAVSYSSIGLWSYYKSRGNWNRE